MTPQRFTKANRRQLARRINKQTAGYLWCMTPAGEAYFAESGVDVKWARIGYAQKLYELAMGLRAIELEMKDS